MDWLTFISNLVRDTAWPVAVVAIFLILLAKAPMLSSIIESIKYKDIEIILHKEFAHARAAADKIRPELDDERPSKINLNDPIFRLAELDPGLAIIEIWRRLEGDITKAIQIQGLIKYYSPSNFARRLAAKGYMTIHELKLFDNLRSIRNSAVHAHGDSGSKLTLGEVAEFNEFADLLRSRIAKIPATPGLFDPD